MVCEPLELEYASAALEKEGFPCEIADMIFERKSLRQLLETLRPDIVAFTAYITHVNVVKGYAQVVKTFDPAILTVVGGIHAEVVPQDFEDLNIDLVLHAGGVQSLVEIASQPARNVPNLRKNIAGVWNGKGKEYPPPRFPSVFPDRQKTAKYRKRYNYIFHSRCALLKASIGCAYSCDFCFCVQIARHRLLERPIASLIEEIKTIPEENIFIVDDNFLFKKERVLEFCEALDRAQIRKKFLVFGRADFVEANEACLSRFRQSGLSAVFMGLESWQDSELQDMHKRLSVKTSEAAVRVLQKLGIECHAGIIVSPGWTAKDFTGLTKWLISLGRPFVNIQPITPMPGTPLHERMRGELCLDPARHELWDMTHLALAPTQMSRRRYIWNIVKAYFYTTVSPANHLHILRRYGLGVYLRTSRGSSHLTWQYIKMWLKG
jgi:radical SAM superfamily enzyme YgiQ (UPF0313 family)